jgi:hypothetical protein
MEMTVEATDHAPSTSTAAMGAIATMFHEPTATYQRLQARPKGWIPMLLLMSTSCALTLWYFSTVDFAWFLDQMLAAMKSPAEREQAAAVMSKNFMLTTSLVSSLVVFPVFFVITGVYLMIVSKALSHGLSFGKGFALAAWSSVPGILLFPLGAMQILLASSGQLGFSELNPVSLNQLLFHYDMAHPLATLMDTISVPSIWSLVLLVIGFQTWAKVKRSTAVLVVLIPHLLVYGAWFAYAMSKAA